MPQFSSTPVHLGCISETEASNRIKCPWRPMASGCQGENYEGACLDHWSVKSWNMVTCVPGGNGDLDDGMGTLLGDAARNLQILHGHIVHEVCYSNEERSRPPKHIEKKRIEKLKVHDSPYHNLVFRMRPIYNSFTLEEDTTLQGVHVHCRTVQGKVTYCAPRCVVTLPLGVLRAGHVEAARAQESLSPAAG
eukprot:6470111-Amphidinium_carterae.2